MSKFFLAVAAILSLSAGTATAKPAPVEQNMQIASTRIDIRGSDEVRNRRPPACAGADYPGTTIGAHATQPAVWEQEPESVNRGTEP